MLLKYLVVGGISFIFGGAFGVVAMALLYAGKQEDINAGISDDNAGISDE